MRYNKMLMIMIGVLWTSVVAMAQEPRNLQRAAAMCDSAATLAATNKADAVALYEDAYDMAESLGGKGAELAKQCKDIIYKLYLELGNEWLAVGDSDKAIKTLSQAVAYGEDVEASILLANTYVAKAVSCQRAKDMKGALDYAQKSVEAYDSPTAEVIVGLSAIALKQNKVAVDALEAYLSMRPEAITEEAGIVYNLGLALVATGDNGKACGYFKQIAGDAEFGMAARYQIVTLKCK